MIKNNPRNLPYKEKPFAGYANTDKKFDDGAPHDVTERMFDKNRTDVGIQSRPREFQPFFRFQGVTSAATLKPMPGTSVIGNDAQCTKNELEYKMQDNTIKP